MKFTIEHSKTRRKIVGTFGICGSREDFESLRDQLESKLRDESWCYGWVSIFEEMPNVPSGPPRGWDE